jgi:hypothetical protein
LEDNPKKNQSVCVCGGRVRQVRKQAKNGALSSLLLLWLTGSSLYWGALEATRTVQLLYFHGSLVEDCVQETYQEVGRQATEGVIGKEKLRIFLYSYP